LPAASEKRELAEATACYDLEVKAAILAALLASQGTESAKASSDDGPMWELSADRPQRDSEEASQADSEEASQEASSSEVQPRPVALVSRSENRPIQIDENTIPPRGSPNKASKKRLWLAEKRLRADAKNATKTGIEPSPLGLQRPLVTLFNLHTKDALPVFSIEEPPATFAQLLRDHFTNQATQMDIRLFGVLVKAADRFNSRRIDIVSGFRSPKYNLTLRKKGRQVAAKSQHTLGHAVDFRLRGVPTRALWSFVRSLKLGGVGYYPHSGFVHADTGPRRFWRGS